MFSRVARRDEIPRHFRSFAPDRFDAYSDDAKGRPSGHEAVALATVATWPTNPSAIVDGRLAYYFASGPFAGFWVPAKATLAVY